MSERIRQGNRPPCAALAGEIATAGGLIPEVAIDSYGGPISQVAQRFADTGDEHRGHGAAPRSMLHEFLQRRIPADLAYGGVEDGMQSIGRERRTVFADN